ncbi:MAG: MBL fold metallo-hydrolase [Flavobacteriaceae bacterium]|nr:MBL fold metallo-hydrolase [Flavobacteriaceae bacterium]
MKIEQIYTGCLFQASYFIESNGESAVIDPLRESNVYLNKVKKTKSKLKYIFETHFHADFVSGHITLSKFSGAPIVFGPKAKTNFQSIIAEDLQEFKVGDITIKVLHTPGHTIESTTYLLIDNKGRNHCIFTGDTLFLGDVGRPDLAQNNSDYTPEMQAGMLFDSIQAKISVLPDDVIVYPAHGAGSACGKNMMKETFDSLGNQKKINYALNGSCTRDDFIKILTTDLLEAPSYFPQNVMMNKNGYEDLDNLLESKKALTVDEFMSFMNLNNTIVLDTRSSADFSNGHIPNSYFIGLNGSFAPWVGEILKDTNINILLIVDQDKEIEAITRLSRVGFDNCLGYLDGGLSSWKKSGNKIETINNISPLDFIEIKDEVYTLDVRKKSETSLSSLKNSIKIPLSNLESKIDLLDNNDSIYIHCAGGYRSMIAASLLKRNGFNRIIDINRGFSGIQKCLINS